MKNDESAKDKSDAPSESSARLRFVLDSYAFIAYFDDEEGADTVADLIRRAPEAHRLFVSIINLGEVAYDAERELGDQKSRERLARLRQMPIAFIGVNERRVLAAAHIKANHAVS